MTCKQTITNIKAGYKKVNVYYVSKPQYGPERTDERWTVIWLIVLESQFNARGKRDNNGV